MEKIIIIIMISCMLCLSSFYADCNAASLYDSIKNGKELFEQEEYDKALNIFLDAQIEYPEDPDLKYNIASTYYKMKNYDESIKGYLDVTSTALDVQLEEKALYNIGNAIYRQGKLQEAVEYYKKALELYSDDKDAKQNLEFVLEEIKRKINEAKKTEQQQEQQQEQEQEQEQNNSDQEQTCQNGQKKDDKGEGGKDGQKDEQAKQEQKQAGMEENEKEGAGKRQGSAERAREMTEEEAEQWLSSIKEDRVKFKNKNQEMQGRTPARAGKGW